MTHDFNELLRNLKTALEEKKEVESLISEEEKRQTEIKSTIESLKKENKILDVEGQKIKDDYLKKFENLLLYLNDIVLIDKSGFYARLQFSLFGKEYRCFMLHLFYNDIETKEKAIKSFAKMILGHYDSDYSSISSVDVDKLIRFYEEYNKNPNIATQQLVKREVSKQEKLVTDILQQLRKNLFETETSIKSIEEFMGDEVEENLINKIFRRRQVKLQQASRQLLEEKEEIKDEISKLEARLSDGEKIRIYAEKYVEAEIQKLNKIIPIFLLLEERKKVVKDFDKKRSKKIMDNIIEQEKAFDISTEEMKMLKRRLSSVNENIENMLTYVFGIPGLLDEINNADFEQYSEEDVKMILMLKDYYSDLYSKKIDNLLG